MAFWNKKKKVEIQPVVVPANPRLIPDTYARTPQTPDWIKNIPGFQESQEREKARLAEEARFDSKQAAVYNATIVRDQKALLELLDAAMRATQLYPTYLYGYETYWKTYPHAVFYSTRGAEPETLALVSVAVFRDDTPSYFTVLLGPESDLNREVQTPLEEYSVKRVQNILAELIANRIQP